MPSLKTVHSPTSWMLRRSENSDIFLTSCLDWTDGCSRSSFFGREKQIYPSHWHLVFNRVLQADLPTVAALMNRLCCSGSHLRGTSLELASSVLVISWASAYIKYLMLKISKMVSVSYTELWLRHSPRQFWSMTSIFLELVFTERQKLCALFLIRSFVIARPITYSRGDTVLRFQETGNVLSLWTLALATQTPACEEARQQPALTYQPYKWVILGVDSPAPGKLPQLMAHREKMNFCCWELPK